MQTHTQTSTGNFYGILETATKLKEIHRMQKWLYGEQWAEVVADTEPIIKDLAQREKCSPMAAAVRWAKETQDPKMSLLILAVAVEIK